MVLDDDEEEVTDVPDEKVRPTPRPKPNTDGRILAEETIALIYDDEGYEADAAAYETNVVVDEPSMAEQLVVPEDSVDPEGTTDDKAFSIWWFAAGGIAITLLVGVITYVCMSKGNANDDEMEGMEMTMAQ